MSRSHPTTPLSCKHSPFDVKKAEIEALKAELCVLDLEENLAKLRLDVLNKRKAVKELHNPVSDYDILPANPQLDSLYQPTATPSGPGMPSYRAFLGLGSGLGDCQYYDIMQFLDTGISGIGVAKGKCAVSKMQQDKISPDWDDSIEDISPMMWAGASVKILSRLIADGELDTEGTLKYLAYMLRITQMDIPYTWKSLFLYDRRCRIMQAATKDGWDREPDGVASTTLVKKSAGRDSGVRVKDVRHMDKRPLPPRPSVRVGDRDVEICMRFNDGYCGYKPCRFVHACSICFGQHPALQHRMATGTPGPVPPEFTPGGQPRYSMSSSAPHPVATGSPATSGWVQPQAKNL